MSDDDAVKEDAGSRELAEEIVERIWFWTCPHHRQGLCDACQKEQLAWTTGKIGAWGEATRLRLVNLLQNYVADLEAAYVEADQLPSGEAQGAHHILEWIQNRMEGR